MEKEREREGAAWFGHCGWSLREDNATGELVRFGVISQVDNGK